MSHALLASCCISCNYGLTGTCNLCTVYRIVSYLPICLKTASFSIYAQRVDCATLLSNRAFDFEYVILPPLVGTTNLQEHLTSVRLLLPNHGKQFQLQHKHQNHQERTHRPLREYRGNEEDEKVAQSMTYPVLLFPIPQSRTTSYI